MNEKRHNRSIAGKIVITSLLACTAIFLSLYISKVTFSGILSTVGLLAKPNDKIHLVNDIFHDVVKLDHLQRHQALKTEATEYNPFLKESEHLQLMLDSLRVLSEPNKTQVDRVDSMKKILYNRDLLFLKYIKLRLIQVKNDTLAVQVRDLSEMIEKARAGIDSNVVVSTKVTKTTIDTLQEEDGGKRTLWNRIFSKRKAPVKQVQRLIEEELKVSIDTVGITNKADSLARLSQAITEVESNRVSRRTLLRSRQAELNQTGDVLIAQLISILNDIEQAELNHNTQQNLMANRLVSDGIKNINAVFVVFIAGIVVFLILIFTDIGRSNRYRRELVVAKEEAEEAGRVKQRFLATMSHELRTPLQTIIGTSEQIRTSADPRPQDIENIHQSSLHLLQIVNEVLDYSRIISGKYVLEQKPFNMHALLAQVREMVQVQLAAKGLTFHYNVSINKDDFYSGDAFRLKQVLLNLLGNAVKFTDQGSVSFTVTEQIAKDGTPLVTFVIADTGAGISAEDLAVIFNEFEQGSNTRKKHGTGLGLSIVKAMIDIQHGAIHAESQLGSGTTFSITLPYDKTQNIVSTEDMVREIIDYKGHVWVVDDDVFILQLCDSILTKHAIPHTCFPSSLTASNTPFPADISVVFLDVRMADMDGITLCGKLKERPAPQPAQYVALTAQAFPEEREAIFQKGFDALVIKPFLERDLIEAIAGSAPMMPDTREIGPDLDTIRTMTGDNNELLGTVLKSFIKETGINLATAQQSIADNNAIALADALHTLAGRCGQVGITSLAAALRDVEIALHEGESIEDILPEMEAIYKDIAAAIATVNRVLIAHNIPTDC